MLTVDLLEMCGLLKSISNKVQSVDVDKLEKCSLSMSMFDVGLKIEIDTSDLETLLFL